jgi:hypothetical protein
MRWCVKLRELEALGLPSTIVSLDYASVERRMLQHLLDHDEDLRALDRWENEGGTITERERDFDWKYSYATTGRISCREPNLR